MVRMADDVLRKLFTQGVHVPEDETLQRAASREFCSEDMSANLPCRRGNLHDGPMRRLRRRTEHRPDTRKPFVADLRDFYQRAVTTSGEQGNQSSFRKKSMLGVRAAFNHDVSHAQISPLRPRQEALPFEGRQGR